VVSGDVAVVPGRGLQVGADVHPLVSGAVHYWRIDPARWEAVLDAVVDLGLGMVETYVPWSVHEVDGVVRFDGRLGVARFLQLAAERGLLAIVRPGPHINAELSDFGFPGRVLWDPACQALGPVLTPVIQHSRAGYFACPSYSSSTFLAEVDRWYDAVMPVLAPLQWPDGPVVAMQVDNEMGYFFFVEPFVMDYHPEAVAGWRTWSGRSEDPPTDGSDDPLLVDSWVRYKEVSRHAALDRLAKGLRDRGARVPLFHNDFPALTTPVDQASLEASGVVDIAGTDLYVTREHVVDAMTAGRTVAGSSRLPYVAELGAGWVADVVGIPQRLAPLDEEAVMLALLLTGVRAWNWYMLVEREHWYGSPIDRHGDIRPDDAQLYRRTTSLVRDLDWWSLKRDARVVLLRDRDHDRRQAGRRIANEVNAVLDPLQFPAGLREVHGDVQEEFLQEWRLALESAGLDFDEGSTDAPPPDLGSYSLVVTLPGPRRDFGPVESRRPGQVRLPAAAYGWSGPEGTSLHRLTRPGTEVIGVVNRRDVDTVVTVSGLGPATLEPLWRPGPRLPSAPAGGEVQLVIPAYAGQLWEVLR
jgi:beta-galactosidase